MSDDHVRPARRFSNHVFAASASLGFVSSSMADSASVRAATSMPLRPMLDPAHAVACQECAGVPAGYVAVVNCTVGRFQPTSPTSVEYASAPSGASVKTVSGPGLPAEPGTLFWISSPNLRSSALYSYPPALRRLRATTAVSAS